MRTLSLLVSLVSILLTVQTAQAQIVSQRANMSQGTYEALVLTLPNMERDMAADLWEDFVKDFYKGKTKYNRKTKEYVSLEVDIVALGMGESVDLYTQVSERGNNAELMLWVDLGSTFLSPTANPERYLEAEKILMRFGLEAARENVRQELDEQEKLLKDMEQDLKKLTNDNEKYHREIEKAKEAIAKAEADIVENEQAQENKNDEIEAQQNEIERIRKKLKDL